MGIQPRWSAGRFDAVTAKSRPCQIPAALVWETLHSRGIFIKDDWEPVSNASLDCGDPDHLWENAKLFWNLNEMQSVR